MLSFETSIVLISLETLSFIFHLFSLFWFYSRIFIKGKYTKNKNANIKKLNTKFVLI